ncbi:MAG: YraN family protein [Atopobiaceae bacterium]|nr:YraN family protein [Atopobiaceae bacterium]
MVEARIIGTLAEILPTSHSWMKDMEVIGEGIGIDLMNPEKRCNSRQIGDKGEDVAALFLERMGIEVLERNWRCSFGEVDIIARDGETIILLEVKTRITTKRNDEIAPELAVGSRKRAKYQKLALIYLAKAPQYDSVRFDVAAVKLIDKDTARIRYLAGAFEWDY